MIFVYKKRASEEALSPENYSKLAANTQAKIRIRGPIQFGFFIFSKITTCFSWDILVYLRRITG